MKLVLETESGGSYADADEETLHRLVGQITIENAYVIVHRDDRPDGYAQTAIARNPDTTMIAGAYVVEYRDGPNDHWQAFTEDVDVLHSVLAGWAFGRDGWKSLVEWKVLDLGF